MNISLNWLTEYLQEPLNLSAEELGEIFTKIGLNCEGIEFKDNDIVFDLETTSNRPDWLGHIGVCRELAAALNLTWKKKDNPLSQSAGLIDDFTRVTVKEPELCPRYTARLIRNVKVGPSPQWMVDLLEACGLRSINNIVDVTNFVLMEYGQPLHAFDFDKLSGGEIIVRRANKDETLKSIDETTCKLTSDMLIIADAEKPVAIAGVMGGLDTEVTEQTNNVLIESAQFDPLVTRMTSRALGIMTDSNYRFERGVDPVAINDASLRACSLILETAGGEIAEGVADVWATPFHSREITLRPQRTRHILGVDVPTEEQVVLLRRLGVEPRENANGTILCMAPSWRADLQREIDLIEEIARLYGYDNIPTDNVVSHSVRPMGQTERLRRKVLDVMTAAGFDEAVTFSFIDAEDAHRFGFARTVDVDKAVRRTNNTLRPSLLPSLVNVCKHNQDLGNANIRLFEMAAVFPFQAEGELPGEFTEIAAVTTGDLRELRGAIEALISSLCQSPLLDVLPADVPGLDNAVSAHWVLDGKPVGIIGMIHADVQRAVGLEKPLAVTTLRFNELAKHANLVRTAQSLPKFPAIDRDLSIIVEETVTWKELASAVCAVPQPLRTHMDYVTTYRGKQIPKGKKSVTMSLEYRSDKGTLTNERVDEEVAAIISSLKEKFSAELRA